MNTDSLTSLRRLLPVSPRSTPYPLRGVMLDLARITERQAYYRSLLPWLCKWGYNLLHLHLADDQCCALSFPSHPELATRGAFSVDEMRAFVALARDHGLVVLPEIETLGHTRFITDHPAYRHLAEPAEVDEDYNALCPAHPESRGILADLIRDTADVFDFPVIHVGLDEAKLGSCPRCRRRFGRNASNTDRFAAHAAWIHEEVRKAGRRPGMWADHLVRPGVPGERKVGLDDFGRDVLMFNWDYWDYEPARTDLLLEAGFEVVVCPATIRWGTRLIPNEENLHNVRTASARSLRQRGKGVVGLVNTVWSPARYLPGAIDFPIAVAGHLLSSRLEDPGFAEGFARDFYGLEKPGPVAQALIGLRICSPPRLLCIKILEGSAEGVPFDREDLRASTELEGRSREVLEVLTNERRKVRQNRERYDDVVLTAEAIHTVTRFGAANRRNRSALMADDLLVRAEAAWARDRYPNDPLRYGDKRSLSVHADAFLLILRRLAGKRG